MKKPQNSQRLPKTAVLGWLMTNMYKSSSQSLLGHQTLSGQASICTVCFQLCPPARHFHRWPLQHGSYLVTETYSASSGSLCATPLPLFDPLLTQNVIVTERVICPIPSITSNLYGPTELRGSGSKIFTEDPSSVWYKQSELELHTGQIRILEPNYPK